MVVESYTLIYEVLNGAGDRVYLLLLRFTPSLFCDLFSRPCCFFSLANYCRNCEHKQMASRISMVLGVVQMFGGGYPPRNYKLTGEVRPQLRIR